MCDTWKLYGGTPDKIKSANGLALMNLTNLGKKGHFRGECFNCGNKGHNNDDCPLPQKEKDKGNKNKNKAKKLTEAETRNAVITAVVMVVLVRSASERKGIPIILNSSRSSLIEK